MYWPIMIYPGGGEKMAYKYPMFGLNSFWGCMRELGRFLWIGVRIRCGGRKMNNRGVTGLEIAGVIFLLGLSAKVLCRLVTTEWDCGAERKKNTLVYAAPGKYKANTVNDLDFQGLLDKAEKETDKELNTGSH